MKLVKNVQFESPTYDVLGESGIHFGLLSRAESSEDYAFWFKGKIIAHIKKEIVEDYNYKDTLTYALESAIWEQMEK